MLEFMDRIVGYTANIGPISYDDIIFMMKVYGLIDSQRNLFWNEAQEVGHKGGMSPITFKVAAKLETRIRNRIGLK
jgi:hypothetical protein